MSNIRIAGAQNIDFLAYRTHKLMKNLFFTAVLMSAGFLFTSQAEDGIRDVERSRGLGDVYKRQLHKFMCSIGQKIVILSSSNPNITHCNVNV